MGAAHRRGAPGRARGRLFAETLGCRVEEIAALADAGFDYLFNSVKWWDLKAPWALEQYEMFRHIAPSVGFPESHDTERLATNPRRPARSDDARKWLRAALCARGLLFDRRPDARWLRILVSSPTGRGADTRPTDNGETLVRPQPRYAAINAMKAACPPLNEEGPQARIRGSRPLVAALRRTNDGSSRSIFVANPSLARNRSDRPCGVPSAGRQAPSAT